MSVHSPSLNNPITSRDRIAYSSPRRRNTDGMSWANWSKAETMNCARRLAIPESTGLRFIPDGVGNQARSLPQKAACSVASSSIRDTATARMSSSDGPGKTHPAASRSSSTIMNEPSSPSKSAWYTCGTRTGSSLPTFAYRRASATPRPICRKNFRCSSVNGCSLTNTVAGRSEAPVRRTRARPVVPEWASSTSTPVTGRPRTSPNQSGVSSSVRNGMLTMSSRGHGPPPRAGAGRGSRRRRRCTPGSAISQRAPPLRQPSRHPGPW
ncbi:MAG: hypothetical protein JWR48_4397 [Mycobacterium sp.]|jgi:hypothetical protein|nr:hypothetical protein [Mycobacterium sp.]